MIALISMAINMTVAQSIQPYLLCAESTEDRETVQQRIQQVLEDYSFKMIGSYTPAYAPHITVMAVTSPDLRNAAKQVGGFTGITSAWRLILADKGDKVEVSYPNPEYWGNAIFQDEFFKVEYTRYMAMSGKLSQIGSSVGTLVETGFGSTQGKSAAELQQYEVPEGGASTDKSEVLTTFDSYEEAVTTIDSNFKMLQPHVDNLYNLEMPEQKMKLYGVGLRPGEDPEIARLLPAELPANMSFLPIEVLVKDGEVHMLNARFIVPMVFPDQSLESLEAVIHYYEGVKELMKPVIASN